MIYGDKKYKDILGIDKLLNVSPKFVWDDIKYIEGFEYYMDLDEYGEEISNLKIAFLIELSDKTMHKLCVRFNEINCLEIKGIGGKYNQIMGFEVINLEERGWEKDQKYMVRDYECGSIEFYCRTIEILHT